jgi:tRNA-2-methylthio-N6-dimethylallyladenosine synthase
MMNRRYTRETYLALVRRLRGALPDITLSTDIMVGFPGETEDDVEELINLMDEVQFSYAFMYHYNVREGTAAASLPGRIPYKTKIGRLSRVIARQEAHRVQLMMKRIGGRERVLVEGRSRKNADEYKGRTEHDDVAVFSADRQFLPGDFVLVRHLSLKGNTFRSCLEA